MAKIFKYLLVVLLLILTSVLAMGIAIPNKYESELNLELAVNSGSAFRIFSRFENYPAWFLLSFDKGEHLSWITGVDGTKGAILHWETARSGYKRGQTRLNFVQPLTEIEIISNSSGRNQRLTIDSFTIEPIDHQNVVVKWNRKLTLQFPYNIVCYFTSSKDFFELEHKIIKEQFMDFYPELIL